MYLRDERTLRTILSVKLKAGREARGLKEAWIAQQLGVHVSTYNKWETGANNPEARQLARIAELENYDLNFYFDENMTPAQADLEHRQYVSPAQQAREAMAALQEQVAKVKDSDPALEAYRESQTLRDLVQLVHQQSPALLREIIGVIYGFLHRGTELRLVRGGDTANQAEG